MIEVILTALSTIGVLVPVILKYRIEVKTLRAKVTEGLQEIKEQNIKLTVLDRVLELTNFNLIKDAVDRIFEATNSDRFLILVAINGKTRPRYVSVIFEEHKDPLLKINAIARYSNVEIDEPYRGMLRQAENVGPVILDAEKMEESFLKDFYALEGVKHSIISFMARESIDQDNDIVVFSSVASHGKEKYSRLHKSFIKTQYEGSIIPVIRKVINYGY